MTCPPNVNMTQFERLKQPAYTTPDIGTDHDPKTW
jgi:hypothetical protein